MNPWWNLPFAVLALLALWCRVGAPRRMVDAVAALLRYFGVEPESPRHGAADFFGVAGVSGLGFVAWGGQLAAVDALPGHWLLIDAILSALGLGLVGAWMLARFGGDEVEAPHRVSREMMMMEVDELPRRSGGADVPGDRSI
jgi:hypothetical protein